MKKILLTIGLLLTFTFVNGQLAGIISSEDASGVVCTFPTILSGTVQGTDVANATSHVIDMPSGATTGDLILVLFACDSNDGFTIDGASSAGWSIESQTAEATGNVEGGVVWCIVNETENLTLATSSLEAGSWIVFRLSCFNTSNPLTVTNTNGNSTNADPPTNTGEYGAVNYFWMAFAGIDAQVAASAAPTDFINLLTEVPGGTGSATVSVATREYNFADAYDIGAFTTTTEQWVAFSIIINPL